MTPLAQRIYQQLLRHLRTNHLSITYGELAASLGKHAVHHRSPRFTAALSEVTEWCRSQQVPCLPAIVWSRTTRRPSDGYYKIAHPRVRSEAGRIAAWQREYERVIHEADRFPASLA